jgi:hypothetical protein
MSTNAKPAMPEDPNVAGVGKAGEDALKALAVLYNQCHRTNPDSPICDAVQQLQSAVAEVMRYVEQVGPDLQEGTPDDTGPPPEMGRDPGPMGGSPMAAAGRGFDQALMGAAQQPPM